MVENENYLCPEGEKVILQSANAIITVNNNVSTTEDFVACDSFTWNGKTYTETGIYTETFETVNGCDSTVTLNLTITNSVDTEENIVACDSFDWNGITYNETGVYTATFEPVNGCDLIATLNLTINNLDDT